MTERVPELTQEELALMAAFEARTGDAAPDAAAAVVPEALRGELDDFVALTRRVDAMPLAPVAPSVRSAIMNAAVAQAQAAAEKPSNPIAVALAWLMRPGPVLIGATAAALVAAFVVRAPPEKPEASSPMVAMEAPGKPAQPAATSEPAGGEDSIASAAAEGAAAGSDSPAPARPLRTFAAEPASLAPPGPADETVQQQKRNAEAPAEPPPAPTKAKPKLAPAKTGAVDSALDDIAATSSGGKRSGARSRRVARAKPKAAAKDLLLDDAAPPKEQQRKSRFAAPPPSADADDAENEAAPQAELAKAPAPSPQWTNPPARPGDSWKLRADDKRKLAQNAYYGRRDQPPVRAASSASGAPSTRNAPSSAPVRPAAQQAPAAVQRMVARESKKEADGKADEDSKGARRDAEQAVQAAVTKLRGRYGKAKSDTERRKLLAQILVAARSSGDKASEAWALQTLKQLNRQVAESKKAAEKKGSKKVANKAGKSGSGAPSRPSASAAPKRAKARAESYDASRY